jgi:hypothetical protein
MDSVNNSRYLNNRSQTLALTNAPIPNWATSKDPDTEPEYRSGELENWFKDLNGRGGSNGSEISRDYIIKLEMFLLRLHQLISHKVGSTSEISCDIIQISNMSCIKGVVTIQEPLIRPCAQDMGFLSLLIWQLIQSCKMMGLCLSVVITSEKMRGELLQICPHFREINRSRHVGSVLTRVMFLGLEAMQIRMDSGHLGISHMMIENGGRNPWELTINRSMLPSAQQLMDQEWVNRGEMRIGRDDGGVSDLMASLRMRDPMRRKRGGGDDEDGGGGDDPSRRRRLDF